MSSAFRIACLQMQTGNELQGNLAAVRDMAREAAAGGAQFILTPEYVLMMDGSGRVMRERALEPDGSPALAELRSLARELKVWLLAGSLTLRTDDGRAEIDPAAVARARGMIPSIEHDRPFSPPQ